MRRSRFICILCLPLVLAAPLRAQQLTRKPVDTGLKEEVQVTLLQVEVLVIDKEGRTVPDLRKDDFSMRIAGVPTKVSSVDLLCPIGAAADPAPLKKSDSQPPALIAPGMKRRVVFAFDYSFLDTTMRSQVLDAAEWMLRGHREYCLGSRLGTEKRRLGQVPSGARGRGTRRRTRCSARS